MSKFEEIKKKLKQYNQEHLLMYYDKMNKEEQTDLLNKIENIDFNLMSSFSAVCLIMSFSSTLEYTILSELFA